MLGHCLGLVRLPRLDDQAAKRSKKIPGGLQFLFKGRFPADVRTDD
jgi:hypothetical protein